MTVVVGVVVAVLESVLVAEDVGDVDGVVLGEEVCVLVWLVDCDVV